jgi:hypothetical protein
MTQFKMTEAGLALMNEQLAEGIVPTVMPFDKMSLEFKHRGAIGVILCFYNKDVLVAEYPEVVITKLHHSLTLDGIHGGLPVTVPE